MFLPGRDKGGSTGGEMESIGVGSTALAITVERKEKTKEDEEGVLVS